MAKQQPIKYVSYSISENHARDTRWQDAWHDDYYHSLTEEDARTAACVYGNIRKARFEKLAAHTSRKFTFVKSRKIEVYKNFHEEPVQYISLDKQQNDHVERLPKLVKEWEEADKNLI